MCYLPSCASSTVAVMTYPDSQHIYSTGLICLMVNLLHTVLISLKISCKLHIQDFVQDMFSTNTCPKTNLE